MWLGVCESECVFLTLYTFVQRKKYTFSSERSAMWPYFEVETSFKLETLGSLHVSQHVKLYRLSSDLVVFCFHNKKSMKYLSFKPQLRQEAHDVFSFCREISALSHSVLQKNRAADTI